MQARWVTPPPSRIFDASITSRMDCGLPRSRACGDPAALECHRAAGSSTGARSARATAARSLAVVALVLVVIVRVVVVSTAPAVEVDGVQDRADDLHLDVPKSLQAAQDQI